MNNERLLLVFTSTDSAQEIIDAITDLKSKIGGNDWSASIQEAGSLLKVSFEPIPREGARNSYEKKRAIVSAIVAKTGKYEVADKILEILG